MNRRHVDAQINAEIDRLNVILRRMNGVMGYAPIEDKELRQDVMTVADNLWEVVGPGIELECGLCRKTLPHQDALDFHTMNEHPHSAFAKLVAANGGWRPEGKHA